MAMDNSIKGIESRGRQRLAADLSLDTVEISDEARRAAKHLEAISMAPEGKWTYYQSATTTNYYRVMGDRVAILLPSGWSLIGILPQHLFAGSPYRRLTPTEVDALALSNPAFAREHFAEQQSEEKPDRVLTDDEKVRNVVGNFADAIQGMLPGSTTDSEWNKVRDLFRNYERFKDKTFLSQARMAIDELLADRRRVGRRSLAREVMGIVEGER